MQRIHLVDTRKRQSPLTSRYCLQVTTAIYKAWPLPPDHPQPASPKLLPPGELHSAAAFAQDALPASLERRNAMSGTVEIPVAARAVHG
jgi:hypothetical protein